MKTTSISTINKFVLLFFTSLISIIFFNKAYANNEKVQLCSESIINFLKRGYAFRVDMEIYKRIICTQTSNDNADTYLISGQQGDWDWVKDSKGEFIHLTDGKWMQAITQSGYYHGEAYYKMNHES